jgi:GH43 family beta-xylosidase
MPINEGPEALVHAGVLRIVYSASGSWTDDYCYGMLTLHGSDPLDRDVWQKSAKPVFASTDAVFGPGHGSFVRSPDGREDWMVYHSARYAGAGWDRVIDAQRFSWRADGTPDFGRPLGPEVEQRLPSGEPEAD